MVARAWRRFPVDDAAQMARIGATLTDSQDKQLEFNNLCDFVLRLLYDSGLDPTLKALSADIPGKKSA